MKQRAITIVKSLKKDIDVDTMRRELREANSKVEAESKGYNLKEIKTLHFLSCSVFETDDDPRVMLECSIDGNESDFLEKLSGQDYSDFVEAIFKHCKDWKASPKRCEREEYLEDGRIPYGIFHIGNTGRSVDRINNELIIYNWLAEKKLERSKESLSRKNLWKNLKQELEDTEDRKVRKAYAVAVTNFEPLPFLVRFNLAYRDARTNLSNKIRLIAKLLVWIIGFVILERLRPTEYYPIALGLPLAVFLIHCLLCIPCTPKQLLLLPKIRAIAGIVVDALVSAAYLVAVLGLLYGVYVYWATLIVMFQYVLLAILLLITVILIALVAFVIYNYTGLGFVMLSFFVALVYFTSDLASASTVSLPILAGCFFLIAAVVINYSRVGLLLTLMAFSALAAYINSNSFGPVELIFWIYALLIALLAVLAVYVFRGFMQLRKLESTDIINDTDVRAEQLPSVVAKREDEQLQNHLVSVTRLKAGKFRLNLLQAVFRAINFLARLTETRGFLGGIASIHFARFILYKQYVIFLGNYDGNWSSYLGDFHSSQGLTAIWSNTYEGETSFPRTVGLLHNGAQNERQFKRYARNSQKESSLWYSAYHNSSVILINRATATCEDLQRKVDNGRKGIRHDLESIFGRPMTECDLEIALRRLS